MSAFKAVIFDWAGTLVDFGSRAPMGAFVEAFGKFGVDITIEEARGPMGAAKRDHIAAIFALPRVAAAFEAKHGHAPGEGDIDALYAVFLPLNEAVAADFAVPIEGAVEAVDGFRAIGMKIGSTTGYTRSIMERVLPAAAAHGLTVDACVCADEVLEGRPAPLGIYKNLVELGVYPPSRVIKVDDTEVGIREGVAAGCISIGVTLSGNLVGKSEAELAALPSKTVSELRDLAAEKLAAAGARHVIDSVADLPDLLASLR